MVTETAAIAFVMVTLGPIDLVLPYECMKAVGPRADPHSCREAHIGTPHTTSGRRLEAQTVAFARDVVPSTRSAASAEMTRAVAGSRHRGKLP